MALTKLGRFAYQNFIRSRDIRPALVQSDLPTPTYATTPLPRNYRAGLRTSIGTDTDHDIDIAVGQARSTGDTSNILVTSVITKQIDATWAAGTAAGGMNDAEVVGNDTWYHLYLLGKTSNDAFDAGFDTSTSAANLLADAAVVSAGFTTYRRITSVLTGATANILAYVQRGNHFNWTLPVQLTLGNGIGAAHTSVATNVPLGFSVEGHYNVWLEDGSGASLLYLRSPDASDQIPSVSASPGLTMRATTAGESTAVFVRTDTSSQIRYYIVPTGASQINAFNINTLGWIDDLGDYD